MESLELYKSLLEFSTDCIKAIDLEARLLFMSGGGCKALEIEDFSRIANTYWLNFWKGTDADAARAAIEAAKAGGIGRFQGYCPTWKGTPKWWDVLINPVLGADGKPEWLVVSSRDITETRQKEDRLRATLESIGDGFAAFDAEWRFVYMNQPAERLLGKRREELLGRSIWEMFPLAVGTNLEGEFRRVASGEPRDFDNFYKPWNCWFHNRCFPRAGGGISIYFQDITESKRTQNAMREALQQLRLITENMPAGVTRCSRDHRYVWVSPSYAAWMGRAAEDIAGRPIPEILGPEYYEVIRPNIERVLSGERVEYERQVKSHEGGPRWIHAVYVPTRDLNHKIDGWIAVVTDVTERHNAEEQRSHLAAIVESCDIGVISETLDGTILSWNRGAEQLYGYKAEEVLGRNISLLVPPGLQCEIGLVRELLGRGERLEQYETTALRKDGHIVSVSLAISPIRDSEGAIVALSAIARDITEQKQAEAKLRESEERFRHMADAAPVMIWVSGVDKLCTFFNKPWLDFTGHTLEHELGNGWTSGVHPEDQDRCLATYSSSFDARRVFQMEYQLRRADGEYRWVLDNAKPLYRGGEFAGYIGSCIDLTEQKLTEERLRASEARLREAQRLAKVGSWELQIDTDSLFWTDEISRIFGLSNNGPGSFSGYLKFIHPQDREKVSEADRKVRSTGDPLETEYRIIRRDGEVRFLRSIVETVRNDQGVAVRLAGATQDITDQVNARELLRESEERLKNAERLAHVGSWYFDIQANRVSWSDEMFRIFGKPRDYTPSYEGFLETLLPQDRQRLERLSRKVGHSVVYQIVRPNGDLRTVSSIWDVVLDEQGSPVRMFGALQDITDVRRAQEESIARQKLESVGTLAGGIAHDFNNLLGGILAEAEFIEQALPADSPHVDELHRIKEGAIRGSEIVRELMIYSGQDQADPVEPVDLSRLVEEMLELLKVSISKRAVLKTDLHQNLSAVLGRASQIRQIVMNLVINASEAIGEENGVIKVATSHTILARDAGPNSPPHLPSGDYLNLEVSDTGGGMTEELQAKIFDPFFSTKFAGRGLGLAVVQGIVRDHGGAINLVSALGQGTKFEIFLPCVGEAARSSHAANGEASGKEDRPPSGTVLVVEDEDMLRVAVSKLLRKKGFSVIEANDGTTALDLLRAHKDDIDLLLLDVTLPGASSREVFEEAKRLRPDLPVIVTSANSEVMAAASLARRVERFIRKPFALDHLFGLIRESLPS